MTGTESILSWFASPQRECRNSGDPWGNRKSATQLSQLADKPLRPFELKTALQFSLRPKPSRVRFPTKGGVETLVTRGGIEPPLPA